MNIGDVVLKLGVLQDRLVAYRGRREMCTTLEDFYWRELDRLRGLGAYDRLGFYASWLHSYHCPAEDRPGAD